MSILSVSVTSPADLLQMVSERYDSGDRRLAGDGIIWETDYLKILKQYNQLTIALHKHIREGVEEYRSMKENVKNMFQECKELVPKCEENTRDKSVRILNGNGQVSIRKIRIWKKLGFQQTKKKQKNIKKERKREESEK